VEFYSKNEFEKLVHLVDFMCIVRKYATVVATPESGLKAQLSPRASVSVQDEN
jgi:hypothetical protein